MDAYEIHGSSVLFSPTALSNTSATLVDELALDPRFQELQTTLRTYLFDEVRSTDNTRQQTPNIPPTDLTNTEGHELLLQHLAQCDDQIPLTRKMSYLNAWICECAPWLDMFDQDRHFGVQIPLVAQKSAAVFFALLALGARQVERKSGAGNIYHDSLELYSQAISSLTPALNTTDLDVPVTACILCVLEMMSVSPRDWRRHLEGCAAIFAHLGINGFSGGLLQAVFWCYARMDLCASIISNGEQSTTLPIGKWAVVDSMTPADTDEQRQIINATFLQQGLAVADTYGNWAVYLCANVCDLLAQRTHFLELGEDNGCSDEVFQRRWLSLRDALEQWYQKRSPPMLPVQEINGTQATDFFPRILFAHWAAISGNQLYHTACILMAEIQPNGEALALHDPPRRPLWHARRIVAISLTNHHPGCLNNAIQPLFIAGKQFTHQSEHKVVVDLLRHIEVCSGGGSRWRIKDLEAYWGYRPGALYPRKRLHEKGD